MRRKKRALQSEAQLQRGLLQQLKWRARPGVLYWHTPNGGSRNAIEAAHLKEQGVVPGVPDIFLLYRSILHGLELKTEVGRLQPSQVVFQEALEAQGARVATAYGLDDALSILAGWGLLVGRSMFEEVAGALQPQAEENLHAEGLAGLDFTNEQS